MTRSAVSRLGVSETMGRRYVLHIKSLLAYAHRLNVGAIIQVRSGARNRRSQPRQAYHLRGRRRAPGAGRHRRRDRALLQVFYAVDSGVRELTTHASVCCIAIVSAPRPERHLTSPRLSCSFSPIKSTGRQTSSLHHVRYDCPGGESTDPQTGRSARGTNR